MDEMITAAAEGDVNTLKDILESNPNYVNAEFYYDYDKFYDKGVYCAEAVS